MNSTNLSLDHAVRAYAEGHPVIIFENGGGLIHGQETLEVIRATGIQLACVTIRGVPLDDWNNSDWPEMLEAARRVFMQKGGFNLKKAT